MLGGSPPPGLPGTNVFEQLVGSFDGSTAWFVLTNGFTTTNAISLAVIGAGGGVGYITLFGLDHWELLGHTNSFFGQPFQFSKPVNGSDAATKDYVDSAIHVLAPPVQMAGAWVLNSYVDTGGYEHVLFTAHNIPAMDMVSSASYPRIDSFTIAGTNGVLQIAQTNLVDGWCVEACTNLTAPLVWQTCTTYTSVTNSGEITLTIPLNMALPCTFFRARGTVTTTTTISAILALLPRTVTNSTDTTYGLGAGVVSIDSNYIYVSVGTNRYRRAVLNDY